MSDGINVNATSAEIKATLSAKPNISANLAPGAIIMNDYRISLEQTEDGGRIIVSRGSEVQTVDILNGANVKKITIAEVV